MLHQKEKLTQYKSHLKNTVRKKFLLRLEGISQMEGIYSKLRYKEFYLKDLVDLGM